MNSSVIVVEGLSRRRQGPGGKYNHHEASSCYKNYVLRPLLILFTTKKKKNRLTLIICVVVFGLLLLSTTTNYNNDSYYSSISSSSTSNLVVNKQLAEIATATSNVTAVTATTTTTIAEKERTASNSQNGPETTTSTSSNTVPSLLPVIPNTTTTSSSAAASSNVNNNNNPTNAKNNNVVVENVIDSNKKKKKKKKKKKVIYSFARTDRSGSAIQDMLFCHAYAFQNNLRYGGACASNWELPQYQNKRHDRELLLKSIGLDDELPLACPPSPPSDHELENDNNNTTKPKPTKNLINRKLYTKQDTLIFTPEYQKYLHSLVKYPQNQQQNDQKLIVVHIRRGDVDPCRPRTYGYPRYIPNYQYIKLIDRYYTTNSSVVVKIFSESTSYENFDVFIERGYDVILDGDIGLVWKSIIQADITILSRSSFSFVPAILSKGIIVYTPFWHQPLKSWHVVDDKLLNETHTEFRKLKELCPPKDNNKKKKKKKQGGGGGGGNK